MPEDDEFLDDVLTVTLIAFAIIITTCKNISVTNNSRSVVSVSCVGIFRHNFSTVQKITQPRILHVQRVLLFP